MRSQKVTVGSPDEWRQGKQRQRGGFTLVELLVVIGIIALLISILLPSLNAARRQATRIACAANIRSIGQSYQLYAADFKGLYPPVQMWHWPNGNWGNPWWDNPDVSPKPDGAGLLYTNGYVKDYRIYYCPAQEEIAWTDFQDQEQHWKRVAQGDLTGLTAAHNGYFHYANWYDQWGNKDHPANRGNKGKEGTDGVTREAPIARSARDKADRVLATDMMMRRTQYDWGINFNNHLLSEGKKRPNTKDTSILVEFEGGNVLYNDGHAEWKNTADTQVRWHHVPDWFEGYW